MLSFEKFRSIRRKLLSKYKDIDHCVIEGECPILLSSPHGIRHLRLGKMRVSETGSICLSSYLAKEMGTYFIAKTQYRDDDANFEEVCDYKDTIDYLIDKKGIKYIVDFHGLASWRKCDINLGIHLGKNIEKDEKSFDKLVEILKNDGFVVWIDEPFSAGIKTVAGSTKLKHKETWTIQVEVNCGITNKPENFEKCKKLINSFKLWLNYLKNQK